MTTTDPGPVPLLFGFRGIRALQVIMAVAALALALGGIVALKAYTDGEGTWLILLAVLMGALFLWLFGVTLRLPTSFVAISADRMRIRFGGFVDTIVDTRDVIGAELVPWQLWRGLGVRTGLRGDVALVAAHGTAARLTLKQPIRVWLIPRLWRISATSVVLSVRNPHKMVERFAGQSQAPSGTRGLPARRKRK